ncbi:Diacetyl reductase [(S)-acetoin forming] [Meiothermus luteus]|jgi:NAD(P)-dependent dehydrogenase (short-subunit alcohol dehydrogenase family)|uniref:Diacetyl reductase [(S)-acetoin forming] n=1 Tax=Meiothermus luteus TaxID=2026184 RepID=A0A399E9E5_9DEIN|nr:SDR family NAD(P)-dependent oxidoreductase [Meiothermus luteus]RIH81347.1 Diacetyl reductase [(S)-acetoin forming] [Meiothermus luteus]RMH54257.1 MAG: SDR family oxidoreductase [Deinococcota bacterium]
MPNALVTGAGSGIGRAIAERLVKDGFKVWITDREEAWAKAVGEALGMPYLRLDVTSRVELEEARERVYGEDGRLDVLVANAGVSTMNRFLDLTEEEWDYNMNVNAKGTFLTLQTFARAMVAQDLMPGRELRGKIIATASMAARQAAPLLAHYSASKFAVLGLVQAAAKELAPHRVTVNAVNPGFVRTPMQEREVAWEARLRGITPEEVLRDYLRQTPLGRLQTPEDVAKAVSFLAGPDSDFLTGEALEVNGGAWIF